MSNAVSTTQQITSMVDGLLGVVFIMMLPLLYALWKTDGVTRRRYPRVSQKVNPKIEALPEQTVNNSLVVVPVVEQNHTEVTEVPLPYDDPSVRLGDHMLDNFREVLRGKVEVPLAELLQREGETVRVAGLVEDVRVFKTKLKEDMANAAITDPSGGAEITLYHLTWVAKPIDRGDIVLIKGKIREGQILVNSIEVVGEVPFGKME